MPLSLAFLLSTILNLLLMWILARKLWVLYQQSKLRRVQRYSRRNSHFSLRPVTSTDVVFLGDSITEGSEWSALFPNRTGDIRNFGIGSDTTTGVLERLAPIVDGHPQAIFLMIGTNDIGLGVPQAETWQSYQKIIGKICASSPKTQVYIQSILPREAEQAPQVAKCNDYLQSLAEAHKASYIDLCIDFADEAGGIDARFSNDHLHLLGPGYRLWQKLIGPYIGDEEEMREKSTR